MSTFEFKELLQNFLGEPGQNLLQLTQMLENSDILKTLEKNPEFGLSLGQFQIPQHEIFGKEKLIKEKREEQINKMKGKKIESQSNKLNVFDFQAVAENQQFLYLQNIQEQVLLQQDQDEIYLHQQKDFNRNSGSFGVNYVNQIQNIIGKNPEQENSAFIKNLQNNVIQDTIETSKTYNKQQMENKQEFFYRQSQMYNKILNKSSQSTFSFQSQFNQKDFQIMIDMSKKINDFGQIKGNNPSLWPENIQEFTENIEKRPISDFFYEQQDFFQEFYSKAFKKLQDQLEMYITSTENKEQILQELTCIIKAIFIFTLQRGSYQEILDFFEQILKIEDKLQQESQYQIASQLKETFEKFWCDKLKNEVINNQEQFNFFDKTKQIGNFKIISNDLINSTSQLFTKSSITSDGTYLYLYVGAMNGNAYKIGTGFNGTLPGHLYFTRALNRAEDASWVYLKGKLYLKTSTSIENKVIYIVDPEIIEMCGKVQLDQCKDLFEKPELFHLNKNFQLLNDENENLYFIGKEIKEIKKELTEEQQKEKIQQIETLFQQNYIEFYQNFCVCNKGHKLEYELKEELEKLSKETRCTQCQLIFNQSNNGGFLCKECKFVRCESCFSHESQQFVQKIVNQLQNNKNKSSFTNLCPSGHQLKHLEPEVLNKLYNITCDNCQAKLKNTFIGTNRCEMCDYDLCDRCNEKEIGYGNAYTGQYGGKQFSYTYSQPQNNYGYGAYNKQFVKGGFQGNTGNNLQGNYLSEAFTQFGPDKCKNNHELTFLSNQDIQNRGIQCDGCRNKLRGTQLGSYRCQKCDFDRCEKCYNIQKYLKEKKEGVLKPKKGEKNEESKNSEESQLDICENQLEKEQRDLMDKKEMEMKKNIIEQVLEEENIIKLMEFYLYKFNVDQLELVEMNDENINNNEEIFDKKIRQFFDIYQQKLKESSISGAEEAISQYWNYQQFEKYINLYREKFQKLQIHQGQNLKTMEKLEKKKRQQKALKENENNENENENNNENQKQNQKQKLPEIQHYSIKPFEKVLLCQSEVVRNQQNEKRGEFQVLPNSFLNPANISQNQWSVGNGIVACYGDKGVMLFSTDKRKERVIFDFEKEKEKEKKKLEDGNSEEGKKDENKDKKNQGGNLVDLIMKNQELQQNIKIEKIKEIYVYLQELGGVENFKKQMNQKIKFGSEKEIQIKDVVLNNEIMYQKLLKHCDKIFNQRSFFKLVDILKQLKVVKYVIDNPYMLESIYKMDVNIDFNQQKLDQSQKKGQIANLNISGTYIKTESTIKYQQNPQDILCYDFKNQLYFQLHWSHNGSSFVMESNINVYFQQMNQNENFKLTGKLNKNSNLKELFLYCCQNLRNLHAYRNYLPFKFNLYDIVYGQGIHKLKQQIINLQKQIDKKEGNEQELKEQIQKHSNLKNKLIQKMNRYLQKEKLLMSEQQSLQQIQANNQLNNSLINQHKNKQIQTQKKPEIKQKEIILRELKKQFTYISEGSQQNFKSLNQILNLFLIEKGDSNLQIIQEILEQLVLVCWNQEQLLTFPKINEKTKNEKQNQNLNQNILDEVENSLIKILENENYLRNEKILGLVLSLVFEHGNKIFLRKKCQQVFWLNYLAKINQKLNLKEKNQNAFQYYNKFLQIYVQNKVSFQFRFQESFIISQFPVQKITNQTNLQEILLSKVLHQTNKKQKISQNSQFEPIGQLFLDQNLVGKIYSEIYEYIQKKNNNLQEKSQNQQNENIVIGIQKFEFKSNFRNFLYPYSGYLPLQEQNQQQKQNIEQVLDEQTIKNLLKSCHEQPCIFIELLKIINLIFSQSWLEISTLIEDYQKYLIYKNLKEMHKKYQKKQEREKNQDNKEEEKSTVKNQKCLEDYDLSYEELFDYKKQMTHQEKMDKNQFQDFKSLSNLKLQDKENIKKMDFELKKRLVLKVVQEIIGPILENLMKILDNLQIQYEKEQDLQKQKEFKQQIDIVSKSIDYTNKALNQIGLLSLNSVLSKVNDQEILSVFNKSLSQICKITVELQQLEQKIEKQNKNENEEIKQKKKSKSSYINGVEAQAMQVFETQHPYEKKQQVISELIQFPGAICLKIEFDLKSATESSQDFLMISGGYKNKQGQTQNPYQAMPGVSSKEGYGNYFRLSGNQFSTKNRQLILIGNFAYIEFQATSKNAVIQKKPVAPGGGAAVSQNEGINPNSWGIKASIYPVYIPEIKQNFLYQFSMQSLINFSENKQIEKFIDKSNLDIFNWNLLMKGLVINENQEKKQNQEDQKVLDSKLVLDNHEQDIYGQINKFKQNLFVKQNEFNQFYFKNYQHSIQRNQSLQQLQKQFKDSQNQKIDKNEEKQQKVQSQQLQQQLKEQNEQKEQEETHLQIEKEKKNNQNLVVLEYDQKQREKLEENILPINWEIYENFQFDGCQQQELLKIYIQEIKKQEGNFVNLLNKIKQQIPELTRYRQEKMRKTFAKIYQNQWEQLQNLIILVILYHNDLLYSPKELENQAKDDLPKFLEIEEIVRTKNKIIVNALQQEVQWEREKQFIIVGMLECLVKQIKQNQEKQIAEQKESKQEQKSDKTEQKNQEKEKNTQKRKGSLIIQHNKGKKQIKVQRQVSLNLKSQSQIENKETNKQSLEEQKVLETPFISSYNLIQESDKYKQQMKDDYLQRYQGAQDETLKHMCTILQIEYDQNNKQENINQIFENCYKAMFYALVQKASNDKNVLEIEDLQEFYLESPYKTVATFLAKKCLVLLLILPNSFQGVKKPKIQRKKSSEEMNSSKLSQEDSKDQFKNSKEEDNQLLPPGMKRITSNPIDSSQLKIDKDKLNLFRKQIKSLQRRRKQTSGEFDDADLEGPIINQENQKQQQQQSQNGVNYNNNINNNLQESQNQVDGLQVLQRLSSDNCSSLVSIIYFLNNYQIHNLEQMVGYMQNQNQICQQYINVVQNLRKIQENSGIYQQTMGALSHIFRPDLFSYIRCANIILKEQLCEEILSYFKLIIQKFNQKFEDEYKKLGSAEFLLKCENTEILMKNFDEILLSLAEVSLILNSFWNQKKSIISEFQQNNFIKLLGDNQFSQIFYKNMIQISILCVSLKNLSFLDKYSIINKITNNITKIVKGVNLATVLNIKPKKIIRNKQVFNEIKGEDSLILIENVFKILQELFSQETISNKIVFLKHSVQKIKRQQLLIGYLQDYFNILDLFKGDKSFIIQKIDPILNQIIEIIMEQINVVDIPILIRGYRNVAQQILGFQQTYTDINNQYMQNYLLPQIEKIGKMVLNSENNDKNTIINDEQLKINNQQQEQEQEYDIIMHIPEELDIFFLIKAFYIWEDIDPIFTKQFPTNYQEYDVYQEKVKNIQAQENEKTEIFNKTKKLWTEQIQKFEKDSTDINSDILNRVCIILNNYPENIQDIKQNNDNLNKIENKSGEDKLKIEFKKSTGTMHGKLSQSWQNIQKFLNIYNINTQNEEKGDIKINKNNNKDNINNDILQGEKQQQLQLLKQIEQTFGGVIAEVKIEQPLNNLQMDGFGNGSHYGASNVAQNSNYLLGEKFGKNNYYSQSFAYDKGGQFSYNKLSISAMLNKIKSQYEETYNQFQEKYKKQSKKLKEKLSQQAKEKAEQKQDKQEKSEAENNKSKEVKANETKSKNEISLNEEDFIKIMKFLKQTIYYTQLLIYIQKQNQHLGFVNLTQIIRLTQSNFMEQEELQNIRQSFNKQKALELAQLIQLCIDDKIEQLQIPGKMDNEFKKKIDPILIWKNIGGNQSQASYAPHLGNEVKNIQILICKKEYVKKIESDKLNFSKLYNKYTISKRNSKNEVKKLTNESPFINDFALTGQGQQQILNDLVKFWKQIIDKNENLKNIVQNQLQQIMKNFSFQQEQLEKLNQSKNQDGQEQVQLQNNLLIGFLTILGGWEDVPQPNTQFYHQQQQQYITILQGGNQSGIQDYKVVKQNSENVEHIVMEQELVEDSVLIEQNIQNTKLINKIFKNKEMIQQFIKILSYLAQNSLLNKKDAENQHDQVNNLKDLWQLYALKSIMKISKYLNWEKLIVNVENNEEVKELIQILKDIYQKNNRTSTQLKEDKQQFLLNWGSYIEKKQEIFNQAFLPTFDCVHKNLQKYLKNKPQNSVQRVNQKQDQDQNLDQDLNKQKEKEVENCTDYTIMSSPYNSSLPEANEQIQENKLLKYWEKHVIPKIIDFVKSSFKAYEMEEFFEQMRIPLRQGDQDKAAQVAYILCDQRLPAGVTLFDSNYDWSSITIEDVKIGQHVLVKIGNNKNLASKYFQESKDLQLDYVCCQVIGYDNRYNMVLVLFKNQLNNKLVTQWVEINRLKKVQSIINSNSFFSDIQEKQILSKLQKSLKDLISQLARQTLIKFSQSSSAVKRQNNNNNNNEGLNLDMQQKQIQEIKQKQQHCLNLNENYRYLESLNLEFIEIMKWSIQQEFSSNPLVSWRDSQKPINQYFRQYQDNKEIQKQLQYVGNQNSENKLDQLYEQLLEQVQKINIQQNLEKDNKCEYDIIFDKLLDYCESGMEKMVDIIMNNYYQENLFQENPIKLNKFQNISEIGSIILVFQSNSQLCQASGLIFSKDQQGANTIKTIFTKKQSLRNIQPLIFNGSDIYCTYYFNAEALPPYERLQISQDTKLECLVYGVPNEWNVLCWLIENISSAITQTYQNLTCENQKNANLEVLKRLNGLLFKTFQKLKGPNILRQILSQMIVRVTRKIQHILSQNEIKIVEGKSNFEQQIQLLGGDLEFVKYLIQEIQQIKNSQIQNDIHLYSSYLQDQIEMASTLLIPQYYQIKEINGNKSQEKCLFLQNLPQEFEFKGEKVKIPDFILDFTNLQILTNYLMQNQWHHLNNSTQQQQNNQYNSLYDQNFQHESKFLTYEMFEYITENLFVKSGIQLQNIQDFEQYLSDTIIENSIIIKDMPGQILQENSEQFMQLLEKQGHKIFNQDTDIYQEEQEEKFKNLLIFTDGKINKQNATSEEEEDEKQEEAKQPEEQKEIEGPVTYNCAMCTFENLWTNQNCEICEAPRPAEPPKKPKIEQKIEEDQEQLKQKELEKKRKKKEKEVKKLKEEIQKFIHTQLLEQNNDLKELEQKKIQLKEEIEEIKQKIENQFKFKSNELISELIKEQDNNLLMDKQAELTKLFKLNYEQLVRQTSSQREEEKRKKLEKELISEKSQNDIKEETESEEDSSEEKKDEKQITVDEEVDLEKLVENQEISDKEKLKKKEEELENIFNEIEEKKVLIDSLVPEIFIGDASQKSVKNLAMDYLNAKIVKSESGELHQNIKSVLYSIQVQSQQINKNIINNIEQEFFGDIIKNSNEIQKMTKQDENKNLSVFEDSRILINIFQQLANQNIIKAWQLLFVFGYDLHLSQSKFSFKELPQIISKKGIKELLQFIEFDVLHKSSDILEFTSDGIRFQEFNEQKRINYMDSESTLLLYKNLKEEKEKSLKNVRYSWEILRYFNSLLNKMIQYTNLDNFNDNKWINNLILSKTSGQQQQSKNLILNTGSYISRLKNLWMVPIKTSLIQKVLQNTAVNRESVPKVTLSRIKLASKRSLIQREQQEQNNISEISQDIKKTETSMIHNNQKDLFIFTKAYEQLKKIHPSKLRPVKPQGTEPFLSFEIKLQGERAQGLSGPYRQFFSDISDELQPKQQGERQLGLLIPTPNNVFNLGDYRDKFMINPEAQSQYQLELLQFLGILMGTCLRTGVHLTLDLPKVFWKQMTNQEIEFQDLVDVDMQLMNLKKLLENSTQEMFEEPSFIETIKECLDSLKQKSQIKNQNLEAEKIEFQNRYVLLQRVSDKIHKQNQNQIDAIKKGLYSILPKPLIKIFSATDLEEFVCGKKDVDLQLLKRHTNYSGDLNENSKLVNYFWEGLEEFTNEQRLRFVKFCWGQERLPNNDIEFERNQIRFMLKPSMNKNQNQKIQDQLLPKADTCFFNLELPNYSSKEILKQRLLIAISFGSDAIDGDQEIQLDDYQNGYLGGRVGRNQEYDSEDDEY